MQRVLVTGASGFIGGHIAREFARRGMDVVATGRNARALSVHAAQATVASCDLEHDELQALTAKVDCIVHCAALASPWGTGAAFHSANVTATQRLLDAARRSGVQRFVHISSPSIYFQFTHQFNIAESFRPARFVNAYAQSKWDSEQIVMKSCLDGFSTVILRPRAVFGAGDTAIMPRILRVARGGRFPLFDRGEALIDVTYVENVVEAAWAAVHAQDVAGECFNITNGAPLRVRELLEKIFTALRWRVRFIRVPTSAAMITAAALESLASLRPSRPEPRLTRYGVGVLAYSQTLNIAAARRVLAYEPIHSIDAGIERYTQWYTQHAAH